MEVLPYLFEDMNGATPSVSARAENNVSSTFEHMTLEPYLRVKLGEHHMKSDSVHLRVFRLQWYASRISPSSSKRQLIGGLQLSQSNGEP